MLCLFARTLNRKVCPENLKLVVYNLPKFSLSVYAIELSTWEINMDSGIEPFICILFLLETNQNHSGKTPWQPKAWGIQKEKNRTQIWIKHQKLQNTQGKGKHVNINSDKK